MHLYYPPCRPRQGYIILTIHALFTLTSLMPVVVEAYLPFKSSSPYLDRQRLAAYIATLHHSYLTPLITILSFVSLFPQARETLSRSSPGSLSTRGLAIQAAVFALVAVYWPFRIQTTRDVWPPRSWGDLVTWYQLVGWAVVDNCIFAFVQGILFWIAVCRSGGIPEVAKSGEMAPLLRD